jgi:ribonuclease P protein component
LPPARYGLPKTRRLLTPAQFSAVLKRGLRSRDEYFSIAALPNGLAHPRLGLAVSRRAAARAVVRNRIKRQVREFFRHHQERVAGIDIIVTPQAPAARAPTTALEISLRHHWDRLAEQCRRPSSS